GLVVRDGVLRIGARVRHAMFHRPVVDGPLGAMLAAVVRHIAHYPIRLRGTFCGSLAHADPAAEWGVVAATLDAELVAVGGLGGAEAAPRRIAAAEAALLGQAPGEALFRAASEAAAAAIDPLEDPETDARYRRELAGAMVYRALRRACPPGAES